jgi:O-antigen/teichoic acid export membrane protein
VRRILAGSVAGQGLVILSYPLLTRLYEPADFGLLVVFAAVMSMISVLSTGSLEAAVLIPRSNSEAASVAWAGIGLVALTALLTGICGYFFGPPIATLLGVPELAEFWWLMACTVMVLGAYRVLSEWMVRDRSYGALGRRNMLQGIGQVAVQVGLGWAGVRPLGLLLGLGVGRLLGIGGLASRGGLLRQPRPRLRNVIGSVRRFRRFPMVASWSALLDTGGVQAPFLIISAIYGDASAGLLGLTIRIIGGPSDVVLQAVYQVFTGEASARARAATVGLATFVRNAVLRLLAVGAIPAAFLVAFSPGLFSAIFGEEWTQSGTFAQLLAVAYLAQFAVTPAGQMFLILERQGLQLVWASSRLALTTGGVALCGLLGAPITTAVAVLGIAQVISYVVLYVLIISAAKAADQVYRR